MGDFLRDAIDFVRERASAAKTGDYGPVHFGAELFALASLIARREADPSLANAWSKFPAPESPEGLKDQLAGLSGALTARELYGRLGAALDFIASLYTSDQDAGVVFPSATLLPKRRIGGLSVEGTVHHWFRPGSLLARERKFRDEEALVLYEEALARGEPFSLPPAPVEDPVVHLGSIGMYWQRPGDTVPRFSPPAVSFDASVPLLWARAGKLQRGFRIALCPLRGEFRPQFEVLPCGKHFRVFRDRDMEGEESLREHLDHLLEAAAKERIHLLVLPELMVNPSARKHLESALRRGRSGYPWGVIGGSFHVWQEGARPANECVVYDHRGRELLRHRKRGAFNVLKHHVTPRFFPRVPVKLFPEIFEDIEKGEVLEVLETPLGRLALLICKDAIVRDSEGLLQLVKEVRPDLLFVVSMTPETLPFDALLKELAEFSMSTLFVNAACVLPRPRPGRDGEAGDLPEDRLLAACRLGLWEGPRRPPTRLRWSSVAADAECAYFYPKDGRKGWRTLADAQDRVGRPGAFLLRRGEEALALVVDLGRHCRARPEVIRKT